MTFLNRERVAGNKLERYVMSSRDLNTANDAATLLTSSWRTVQYISLLTQRCRKCNYIFPRHYPNRVARSRWYRNRRLIGISCDRAWDFYTLPAISYVSIWNPTWYSICRGEGSIVELYSIFNIPQAFQYCRNLVGIFHLHGSVMSLQFAGSLQIG